MDLKKKTKCNVIKQNFLELCSALGPTVAKPVVFFSTDCLWVKRSLYWLFHHGMLIRFNCFPVMVQYISKQAWHVFMQEKISGNKCKTSVLGNSIRKKSPAKWVIIFWRSVKCVGHKLTVLDLTLDLSTINTQNRFQSLKWCCGIFYLFVLILLELILKANHFKIKILY